MNYWNERDARSPVGRQFKKPRRAANDKTRKFLLPAAEGGTTRERHGSSIGWRREK